MANQFWLYIWQLVFVQQLGFAYYQSGIETLEVRVRGQDEWAYIANIFYRFVSTAIDAAFSHASRNDKLFKFEYVVIVTLVRPLDTTTLK